MQTEQTLTHETLELPVGGMTCASCAARVEKQLSGLEGVISALNRDYPGAEGNDLALPIRTVYIKTHDGTDWMSTYDPNPSAVSGPDALRNLIDDRTRLIAMSWIPTQGGLVNPAAAVGMFPVLIDRRDRFPDATGVRITSLDGLPAVLGL